MAVSNPQRIAIPVLPPVCTRSPRPPLANSSARTARSAIGNIHFGVTARDRLLNDLNDTLNMGFYVRPLLLSKDDDGNFPAG
jgi:hypothetical protein